MGRDGDAQSEKEDWESGDGKKGEHLHYGGRHSFLNCVS